MGSEAIKMDWNAYIYSGLLMAATSIVGGFATDGFGESQWLIASILGVLNVVLGALWTTVATLCGELLTAMAMAALLAWGFIGISIVAGSGITFMEMMHSALEDGVIVIVGCVLALGLASVVFALKAFNETVNREASASWN